MDHFAGLKENVIMGRLIPAGTGFVEYRKVHLKVERPEPEDLVAAIQKEQGESAGEAAPTEGVSG